MSGNDVEHWCDKCNMEWYGHAIEFNCPNCIYRELSEAKDNAYSERNKLVLFLTKCYSSYLGRHPDSDKDWEDDWRNIVYVHTPEGQLSWHIHDSELSMFSHLPEYKLKWDGHTTEEKYKRLSRLKGFS